MQTLNELILKRRPIKNRISITLQAAKIITLLKNLQKAKGVAGVYVTLNLFTDRSNSSTIITFHHGFGTADCSTLREKCQYSELFWSAFSCIRTEYGKMRTKITPNTDSFYGFADINKA